MNYLGIDTSGKNLTVIISYNGKDIVFDDENCGVRHSERLMPLIENLLVENKVSLKEMDFFACCVGAGSFTGIRIAVATVKALAMANGKKGLGVTSFDCLAYNKKNGNNLAVIDAGHDGYYVAGYSGQKLTLSPQYVLKEQLKKLSEEYTLIAESDIKDFDVQKVNKVQGFINAVKAKESEADGNLDNLVPLYCRKSQAEEGR